MIKETYETLKKYVGFLFTWVLFLILLTGGKITIRIGLIDWIMKIIGGH